MVKEEVLALWAVANAAQELVDSIKARRPVTGPQDAYVQDVELALKDLRSVAGCTLEGALGDFDFYYVSKEVA